MSDQAQQSALLSALTTDHFVLQSAASTISAESGMRATLYVMALSSSLVAMGFAAQSTTAFVPLAAAVIPTVFVLGIFTVVRLIETGMQRTINGIVGGSGVALLAVGILGTGWIVVAVLLGLAMVAATIAACRPYQRRSWRTGGW